MEKQGWSRQFSGLLSKRSLRQMAAPPRYTRWQADVCSFHLCESEQTFDSAWSAAARSPEPFGVHSVICRFHFCSWAPLSLEAWSQVFRNQPSSWPRSSEWSWESPAYASSPRSKGLTLGSWLGKQKSSRVGPRRWERWWKSDNDAEDDSQDDDGDGDALIFEVNVLVPEEDGLVTERFRRNPKSMFFLNIFKMMNDEWWMTHEEQWMMHDDW